jgi:catalase
MLCGQHHFTRLSINDPECPFAHFQQNDHMVMRNPGLEQLSVELAW